MPSAIQRQSACSPSPRSAPIVARGSPRAPPPPVPSAWVPWSRCTTPIARCPRGTKSPPGLNRSGATGSGCPSTGEPVVSLDTGCTPLVEAPALARRLGVATSLAQERRRLPSLTLASRTGWSPPRSTRPSALGTRHRGLRLDRQPGQRGRRPGGAGRSPGLDLHSPRSRGRQGRRHRHLRSASGPGARHLRRREPALRAGGRPLWLGHRQLNLRGLLRRRLQDHGLRDRRAAGLAAADGGGGADGGRLAAHQARQGIPRVHRGGAGDRPRRRDSSARRRSGCAPIVHLVEQRRRADRAGRARHHRPLDRDRESGRRAVRRARHPGVGRLGRRQPATRRSSTASRSWRRPPASSPRRPAASPSPAPWRWRRTGSWAPTTRSSSASPATDSRPSRRPRPR